MSGPEPLLITPQSMVGSTDFKLFSPGERLTFTTPALRGDTSTLVTKLTMGIYTLKVLAKNEDAPTEDLKWGPESDASNPVSLGRPGVGLARLH